MSQFLIRQLIIPDKFINKKSIYWMLLTIATSLLTSNTTLIIPCEYPHLFFTVRQTSTNLPILVKQTD